MWLHKTPPCRSVRWLKGEITRPQGFKAFFFCNSLLCWIIQVFLRQSQLQQSGTRNGVTIKVSVLLSVVRNIGMKYWSDDMNGFVCCKCPAHTVWEREARQNIPSDVLRADKKIANKAQFSILSLIYNLLWIVQLIGRNVCDFILKFFSPPKFWKTYDIFYFSFGHLKYSWTYYY